MICKFKTLALFSSALSLFLAGTWGFAPKILLPFLGAEYASSAGFVARRYGALYLAIAVILFLARSAEASAIRSALAWGIAIGCALLGVLGVLELIKGHVGSGIWIFVAFEVVLAIAFIVIDRKDRGAVEGASATR